MSNLFYAYHNSNNVRLVAAAGPRWMRGTFPGVSSPQTTATWWIQWINQILMVKLIFPPFTPLHTRLTDGIKIFDFLFRFAYFLSLTASRFINLSVFTSIPLSTYLAPGITFCEIWHGWPIRKHDWLCSMQVFLFSAWFPRLVRTWLLCKEQRFIGHFI